MEIEWFGETLQLLPAKAVWWPAQDALLLSDTHFGKAAAFRRSGVPVPAGTTRTMLSRLTQLIRQFSPQRLLILGDFVHSAVQTEKDFTADLLNWRAAHDCLSLTLVRGNHDRGHARLWQQLNLAVVDEPWACGPFDLCHQPSGTPCDDAMTVKQTDSAVRRTLRPVIAGHLHPCVRLSTASCDSLRLPVFHLRQQLLVLPAFGEFTGMRPVIRVPGDRIFAVADDRIIELARETVVRSRGSTL